MQVVLRAGSQPHSAAQRSALPTRAAPGANLGGHQPDDAVVHGVGELEERPNDVGSALIHPHLAQQGLPLQAALSTLLSACAGGKRGGSKGVGLGCVMGGLRANAGGESDGARQVGTCGIVMQ